MGHLFRVLKRLGELGKTVFIFYTDNGVFFGEHRVGGGKLYPYEEADRTPLFIRLPARYRKGTGGCQRSPSRWRTSTSRRRSSAWRTPAHVHERVAAGSWTGDHCLRCCAEGAPEWAADRPLGVELQLQNANSKHAVCKYAECDCRG